MLMSNNTKPASKLCKKLELFFLNLNLFPSVPPTTDEYQLRNQHISTRLFNSLLIISLSILFLYISLINITETVNVKAPSIIEYEQLYNSYSQTLTCECTQISINYEKFIQIQYTLHQICHSDFVTQHWIDYLTSSHGNDGAFYDTFRTTGTFVFQALSTFCVLVDETISNSLIQFYSTQYVSAYVTSENVFKLQIEAFISQFILSTTNQFLLSLSMIRKTTQSNALFTGQLTNYNVYLAGDLSLTTKSVQYDDCTCTSSATCIEQYTVINYPNFTQIFPLPGLYIGCYIIESLLQSNLQCFYDQVCIDTVQLYLGSSKFINATALDISLSVQFFKNSTIADVLDQLMVEEWNSSSIYEDYYSECQPSGCSYTVTTKNSAIYIITTLTGLVGGLLTVLKLMVPILVKFARKRIHKEVKVETETLVQEPNYSILYKLKYYLSTFNFFPSVPPTTDEHQLRNQRISTRLFIFVLIILLFILLLYTSLINITETVNIKSPSIKDYKQLYNSHSQTLTCECTQISINYEKFIQIQYTLHQICHSDFVTQAWIDYLATSYGNNIPNYADFRATSTFTFQAMSAFCTLVNQTISNRLIQFNSSQYVSASVTPENVFQLQTKAFISQFKSATTNKFLLSLSMIRNTTQSNALLSGQLTNFRLSLASTGLYLGYSDRSYRNCTCSSSATCISASPIYDLTNGTLLFTVPGVYTGCYIIESLLQSNLKCFYNQTCINILQSYFQVSSFMNVTALNISLPAQFLENSTIVGILDQLMVEEWINSSMYENYYSECQPSGCSYTVTTKNSAIYIITTLIGLVGGLITVLKFVVPNLVKLIQYTLHQICHSDFVTQEWIDYLDYSSENYIVYKNDFRSSGASVFQALSTFCVLVDETISNSLIQFNSNQYVSASVIPENVFQLQTDAFISQFKSSTTNQFLLSLAMIRNITQSNTLFSGRLTNYIFIYYYQILTRGPRWYDITLFTVPGLYTGCYMIESLLQSNLKCFYNQTCINILQSYFQAPSFMNVTALNISSSVQFFENSTIAGILDQLMVEEWINSSIYENYYSECQPSGCSYTVMTKNSAIYIITTLIGLVGGLITVLKLMVPYLVKILLLTTHGKHYREENQIFSDRQKSYNEDASVKQHQHILKRLMIILFGCLFLLAAPLALYASYALSSIKPRTISLHEFSEGRARDFYPNLTQYGPRASNTYADYRTRAFLISKIYRIRSMAKKSIQFEINLQNFTTKNIEELQNIAFYLNFFQKLVNDPSITFFQVNLIALFTSAEEMGLNGAEAFIINHPWKNDIRRFINIDSGGGNEKAILYRVKPPQFVREYSQVPRPHANVIGDEILG
ncbi:unnamed protein product [Adineta steineri]|uniref:Peptidase M28 domain-containing protein n=1 Tax=Adineta steineri TaxID=433720 RepID=A0A819ID49_9BILA|nr:unnamed protein product [Adineta steineri]